MHASLSGLDVVRRHYARADLGNAILAALAADGKDLDRLRPEDLAPIDEFHIRGRQATLELAEAIGLDAGARVLDVGSGLGGASRCLAAGFGCHVTGVDLTPEYCEVATLLAQRTGLGARVQYRQGDATALPFADGSFDVVWTQHVAMNVEDKRTLYREMRRVLRPGGALAIYDVLAGPSGPVLYPVPWARSPDASFLVTPQELRSLLDESGLVVESWSDTTAAAGQWFAELARRIAREGHPPLGFHLLLGGDFAAMAQNQKRNLEEDRIVLAQVVARAATPAGASSIPR